MIEVIVEHDAETFLNKVNGWLAKGYSLSGAEVAKTGYTELPFLYTAILIKK